jgi:thiol-disulfide isomerase/thioredoxin
MRAIGVVFFLFMAMSLRAAEVKKADILPGDAETAWKELEKAMKPPAPPAEWATKAPTEDQRKEFYQSLGDKSETVADLAKEFYTRFPEHSKAAEAKEREEVFRKQAKQFRGGNNSATAKVSPEDKAFRDKMNEVKRRALNKQDPTKPRNGMPEVMKEMERGLRELIKEYPERPEPWQELLSTAEYTTPKEDQIRILDDVVAAKAADPETVKQAKSAIRAISALGHPIELAFTAPDGRKVDMQKLKGKVVLIDFWASWCGPCMSAMPEVVALYKKYQPEGLEIVGINLDKERPAMERVVNRMQIPWPSYFDGTGWGNKIALEYNVRAIPTTWLVDKKGILRTMNAGEDLEKQVEELLAEK